MIELSPDRRFQILGIATALLLAAATLGSFLIAPEDAGQGVSQRIFYFHVAIALTSLIAFGVAFVAGVRYLRTRDPRHDEAVAVAVGLGLMLSALTVVTGSIWAKASWGVWWVWGDPRLVTYVIVILLYVSLLLMRSSVDGERRARYSAIFAVAAFASVPLSFYAVRVAQSFTHPVVFTQQGAQMPFSIFIWFLVSQVAFICLFATLMQFELFQRRAGRAIEDLKLRLERAGAI